MSEAPLDGNGTVKTTPILQKRAVAVNDINGPPSKQHGGDGSSTESEAESEEDDGGRPGQVSERRHRHNAILAAWLSQRAAKITREEIQATADDDELSVRALLARQDSKRIIDSPREYQLELFEKAKKQNTIAVLDTGSGKTLIAVMLLRYMLDQELEDRAQGKPHRLAFFVVASVTLAFQQHSVLTCNLDHKIALFYGDMNVDLYSKAEWDKHFKENMVVVCTAEVLYNCLAHAFTSMEKINLLVFDEAHHAKKDHNYSRIVKEFYHECDSLKRPKIFGMTASPVDAKVDIVKAASELERLLYCQIATAADLSLLQSTTNRPTEQIIEYGSLPVPYPTLLCKELEERLRKMDFFKRLLQTAKEATSELGEWCADQLWATELAEDDGQKIENKLKQKHARTVKGPEATGLLDGELEVIKEACGLVKRHEFALPSLDGNATSSKVRVLKRYLDQQYENPTHSKCIVFVSKRSTARLLADLFVHMGTPHLRHACLIGTRPAEVGDMSVTVKQQARTLHKFRQGELNCLFATSIAEEGLDISDCNIVVRFDLYSTMIQYVQSRGRARHHNSRYVHMLEHGNRMHTQALKMVRDSERIMREFCGALPADRLLKGNECDLENALVKEKANQIYKEPTTGAKLTYYSCLVLLGHFVDCLPHEYGIPLQPTYVITTENRQFVCEVLLPEVSPIRSVLGRPASRRAIAKRSAAFEACLALRKGGYLDNNLLPTYHKQLPAMRNALLALDQKDTSAYDMRLKPDCWAKSWGSVPEELYLTVLDLSDPTALERMHVPLALLTRRSLFEMPRFPIYPKAGAKADVLCTPVAGPMVITQGMLHGLTKFTLRIYKDLFNKTFEFNEPAMSYWIAPLLQSRQDGYTKDAKDLIDWKAVDFVMNNEQIEWSMDTPPGALRNRFLVDRWNGGRRFFSERVVPELRPSDPVPEGSAAAKYMDNILDYTVSLFTKSRVRATWIPDQPVILAHRVLLRKNWLDAWDDKEQLIKTVSYVCPEPLKHSALSTAVATMAYLFPAIIFRIESYLIAQEACRLLGLTIDPALALEAVTKDSDNTEEHKREQIHLQRGMGKNYERLEFIGDAFLKMATSIILYARNAGDDEFESHVKRMLMICNKNLYGTATKLRLYEYIRSQSFSRRTWYPEGIKLLEGKGHKKTGEEVYKHHLNDKTIADVCEALIGASLLSYNDTGNMDMAVKAVTAVVASPDHAVERWDDYYKAYEKPEYQTAPASAAQLDLAAKVEKEHDYHFKYPRLLRSAFMHPSYPFSWERIPCYQRLEFLGDSLLDMVCVNFLFYRHPDRDPQWLTEHKMAMVSNRFLGALCVKLGFHRHLRTNHSHVMFQVSEYVSEITEVEKSSQGARDYWTMTVKQPPKCLPDVVEAYIGAIFVDSEFDYKEVERFFDVHIRWFFEDMSIYDSFANNHPTTYLGNLLNDNFTCSDYRVMSGDIPSAGVGRPARVGSVVIVHDRIIAYSISSSSRYGKVKASQNAIDLLQGLAPFEYRHEYHCTCSSDARKGLEGQGEGEARRPLHEAVGTAI